MGEPTNLMFQKVRKMFSRWQLPGIVFASVAQEFVRDVQFRANKEPAVKFLVALTAARVIRTFKQY